MNKGTIDFSKKDHMCLGSQQYTFTLPVYLVSLISDVGDPERIITNCLYYYCKHLEQANDQ